MKKKMFIRPYETKKLLTEVIHFQE